MGFKELFSSSLGNAARAKASLVRGMSGWLNTTLATVQAAGPEIREYAYSALWAEVDSAKELTPVTPAMLCAQLRKELWCDQKRTQRCAPSSTSCFCKCGGVPLPPSIEWRDEEMIIEDCPSGRNLCHNGVRCVRHHGPGVTLERVQVLVEAPKCPHCQGTGKIPRSEPMQYLRNCYEQQQKTFARPSNPLHEWVLEEGSAGNWGRRCQNWRWTSSSQIGFTDEDLCDVSTWMAAAQILLDEEDCAVCFPGSVYKRLNGGGKGYDDWCRLPPNKEMCSRLFDWWHRKYTPGYHTPEDTLADFVKPRMGECTLPIERDVHLLPREWSGKVPRGDTTYFNWCLDGLQSSLEEFLDVFYDCAAQFDGELEISLGVHDKATRCHGKLGGVQVLFTTPAVCSPAKLLPEIGESDFIELEEEETVSIPPLFKDNGLSELYMNLILKQAVVTPTLMAHPDQDETEDQLDHLENKQGGEIVSTPSFIKMLKDKRKEVRGKEFVEGSEGRLVRSADLELSKKDIFLAHTLMDKFHGMSIVKKFGKSDPKLTKVCVDLTNQEEVIRFPAKELQTTSEGVLSAQTFTVLNRPQFKELNKLAEAGWKEAKSVCLNLHIRSYLPVHLPVYAFCVIMWGHSSNAEQASLSGAYVYLGDQEASVLQLPLLCGYIGDALEDMDAYRRSLVLSTCFFGTSGLSAGQSMFGITAVEFTEYLPTSYGGITHERDSWNQMLRNHQGVDKQRFISGFNVVDFVEAGKEKQLSFPEFDLQPVPKSQPIVRTFGEEKQPLLNKSRSMRVKTFSSFRAGNIPVGRRLDNTTEAINYELARASTSNQPRLDESSCNLKADGDFACGETITLPATSASGSILAKIDLISLIKNTNTRVCSEWLMDGYVSQNLRAVSHLAPNSFSGISIWYIFDAYGKIPADISTTIELEMAKCLSPHVQTLRDATTSSWVIDFHKMCGQTLNFSGPGFCKPTLYVVVASEFQLARSAETKFRLEFYATGERLVRGLSENPLTYPIESGHLEDLDLILKSGSIAVGTYTMTKVPVSLAMRIDSAAKRQAYSYAAGILSHFLGVGGEITFSVHSTASTFVSCSLRIALWGTVPTTDELAQIPHVDVTLDTKATLQIQSPFFATANFGDDGTAFYISTLCAPLAPETMETGFQYYIHIHGIKAKANLCREINYNQHFAWFMLEHLDTNITGMVSLKIPARMANLTSKEVQITNFVNALAIMCATTGMHFGKCTLHFSWNWFRGKLADQSGVFSIQTGMGKSTVAEHFGGRHSFNYPATNFSLPFQFGSFAGPISCGGEPMAAENWVRLQIPNMKWITSLTVSIEVHDGFQFYGRSAGPLTIPA